MKSTDKACKQGDVMMLRVKALPTDARRVEHHIVTHSETGHHHVADSATLYETDNPLVGYLRLEGVEYADVVHHKSGPDAHETWRLLGGDGAVFQIRRQRESAPEGWRSVQD
jgi:hypothetical protein